MDKMTAKNFLENLKTKDMFTRHWSSIPGDFISRLDGKRYIFPKTDGSNNEPCPEYTGSKLEWLETLYESILMTFNEILDEDLSDSKDLIDKCVIFVNYRVCKILEKTLFYNKKENKIGRINVILTNETKNNEIFVCSTDPESKRFGRLIVHS